MKNLYFILTQNLSSGEVNYLSEDLINSQYFHLQSNVDDLIQRSQEADPIFKIRILHNLLKIFQIYYEKKLSNELEIWKYLITKYYENERSNLFSMYLKKASLDKFLEFGVNKEFLYDFEDQIHKIDSVKKPPPVNEKSSRSIFYGITAIWGIIAIVLIATDPILFMGYLILTLIAVIFILLDYFGYYSFY